MQNLPKHLLQLGFLVILFFVILVTTNLYQYYRIKSNISEQIISDISIEEIDKIKTFFNSIESVLNLVREWGKNGILNLNDINSLNAKLFPLIQKHAHIKGIILASTSGREYYLFLQDKTLKTRVSERHKDTSAMAYQRWLNPDMPDGETLTTTTDYNPKTRPWFTDAGAEAVHWTQKYTFFESKKEGITASVQWNSKDLDERMVFGVDISVSALENLLDRRTTSFPGYLFLTNNSCEFILTQ